LETGFLFASDTRLLTCLNVIGNEIMHRTTTGGKKYLLRVELESYEGEFIYAEYSHFYIGPESDNYTLPVSGATLHVVFVGRKCFMTKFKVWPWLFLYSLACFGRFACLSMFERYFA